MPEISRFFGIVVSINFDDHDPPHFHARYAGGSATFRIQDLSPLAGSIAPRARGMVIEWASQHQRELLDNWNRARANQPLQPIEPLE